MRPLVHVELSILSTRQPSGVSYLHGKSQKKQQETCSSRRFKSCATDAGPPLVDCACVFCAGLPRSFPELFFRVFVRWQARKSATPTTGNIEQRISSEESGGGRTRRSQPKRTSPTGRRPLAAVDHGNITHGNSDHSDDEIGAAVNFVSASQKKIEFFKNDVRPDADRAESVVLCELGAFTAVVAGATCRLPRAKTRGSGAR